MPVAMPADKAIKGLKEATYHSAVIAIRFDQPTGQYQTLLCISTAATEQKLPSPVNHPVSWSARRAQEQKIPEKAPAERCSAKVRSIKVRF